jgi:hypothetical protein
MNLEQTKQRLVRRTLSSKSRICAALAALTLGATVIASAHEVGDSSAAPTLLAQSAGKSNGVGRGQAQRQGVLTLLHTDYFAEGKSEQSLVVHEDNGNDTHVRFSGAPPKMGSRVSVTGTFAQDGSLDVSSASVLADAPTTLQSGTGTSTQNALFILVKFLDTGAVPFAQTDVQAIAEGNSNSVEAYYQEVSYGHQLLNVTVTPWVTAQMNTSTTCDYTSIANAANSAATAAGYNLSSYVNKFYVMPHNSACGWAGLAYVGSPYQAWSNGYNSGQVYTHELGHNFGLYHAGSVSCLGTGCSASEYGDPYSTMGNQAMMHYDSYQKVRLGWLPGYATHSGGTATYSLAPFEVAGGGNYAVTIPAASNRTYWIEYRQPTGHFDTVSGVQFRVSSPFQSSSGSDDTEIFNSGVALSGLPVGSTYTDSTYGISVTVTSATTTGATIQVTSASIASTSTGLTSSLNPAQVGNTVTFTAKVTGTSPTGTVQFTADGSALCTVSLSGGSAPCGTSGLSAGTHSIVAAYGGDANNKPSTSSALSESVSSNNPPPPAAPPSVAIMSPTNGATVSGVVTLSANASASAGVSSLTLSLDGKVVASTNTGSISSRWNTKKASSGTHTISSTVKDKAGNQATATISVKK